jgi:hypothetical protein
MINLSDAQRILLSSATQRENSSLLPPAPSLRPGGGTTKALAALLKRGLAEERETGDPAAARRLEDDIYYGVFITAAGASAIGVDLQQGDKRAGAVTTTAGPAPRANGIVENRSRNRPAGACRRCHPARVDRGDRLAAAYHAGGADGHSQEGP